MVKSVSRIGFRNYVLDDSLHQSLRKVGPMFAPIETMKGDQCEEENNINAMFGYRAPKVRKKKK